MNRQDGSFLVRGVKGNVAFGISTVAWLVIFLAASWLAIKPSSAVFDSLSSLEWTVLTIFGLCLWGWLVSTLLLLLIFATADWVRHRLVQK